MLSGQGGNPITTVAWRAGVLAADKKASSDGTAWRVTKLRRTKTHAIAFAGNVANGLQFIKWFSDSVRREEYECPLNKETEALVMDLETGECEHWDCEGIPIPIEDKFAAIGSGAAFAIGAMSFGASAIEAVECASEWDNDSGLGVNYATSKVAEKRGPLARASLSSAVA